MKDIIATEQNVNQGTDSSNILYQPKRLYNNVVKRFADLIMASFLTVLLSPLFLLIIILVKLDSRGSALYRGIRTGRFGKEFKIFKFRTMVENAEYIGGGTTALNDHRITRSGAFLRKSKLDEIPQLFNIILGDMSFIGPRPELTMYTKQYEGIEKIILNVRPGITDLSSLEFIALDEIVGGENADEAYEKYVLKRKNELRVEYVLKQSATLDFKLFFKTILDVIYKIIKVIMRRGLEQQYGIHKSEKF